MNIVTEDLDARPWLRHACATIAYRGGKVLRDAPASFASFRVGERSRSPSQILAHLCDLLDWAVSMVAGQQAWHDSTPGDWNRDVERFFSALAALDAALAAPGPLPCDWTRLFQGPIADALTHIGQLAMLRRLADSPVRGENYYRAEIAIGHVGPEQPAPKREFD